MRRKVEASIEKAKKEWEETFDAISDPLFLHDSEFKVIKVQQGICKGCRDVFSGDYRETLL